MPDVVFFWLCLPYFSLHCSATITSSSENEERSVSSEVPTKDECPEGSGGVMGHANEDRHPRPARDNLTAQPDEALSRTDIMEPRTPPAPKRPLPQHHLHSTSSLAMPRPNSVAGTFPLLCVSLLLGDSRNGLRLRVIWDCAPF